MVNLYWSKFGKFKGVIEGLE